MSNILTVEQVHALSHRCPGLCVSHEALRAENERLKRKIDAHLGVVRAIYNGAAALLRVEEEADDTRSDRIADREG